MLKEGQPNNKVINLMTACLPMNVSYRELRVDLYY